jgi:choline transport protein
MSIHQPQDEIVKHEYDVHSQPTTEREPGASDDSLSDRHQGTYHDVRDMGRLGKKQEFMVSSVQDCSETTELIDGVAKLPFLLYSWFHQHTHVYLGSYACVSFNDRITRGIESNYVSSSSAIGLTDGGRAGIIWTYVGTVLMMTCVIASMADMASMGK